MLCACARARARVCVSYGRSAPSSFLYPNPPPPPPSSLSLKTPARPRRETVCASACSVECARSSGLSQRPLSRMIADSENTSSFAHTDHTHTHTHHVNKTQFTHIAVVSTHASANSQEGYTSRLYIRLRETWVQKEIPKTAEERSQNRERGSG